MEQMGAGALHSYSRGRARARARRRSPRCAKLCPPPRARAALFPPCGAPGPEPIRKHAPFIAPGPSPLLGAVLTGRAQRPAAAMWRARARARCLLGARAAAARSKSNGRIDRHAAHATRRHDPAIIPTSSIIQLALKKKKAKEEGTGAKGGAAAAVDDADAMFLLRTENIWRWSVRGFCSAQARGACRSARPAGRGADFAGAPSLFSAWALGVGKSQRRTSQRARGGAPPRAAQESNAATRAVARREPGSAGGAPGAGGRLRLCCWRTAPGAARAVQQVRSAAGARDGKRGGKRSRFRVGNRAGPGSAPPPRVADGVLLRRNTTSAA